MYEDKEWVEYLSDRIPMKRPGQPDDLDSAVVFLAAESSRYITGQTCLWMAAFQPARYARCPRSQPCASSPT